MIEKNVKNVAKKSFSFHARDIFKNEATPYRDWRLIAVTFFVILSISLFLNIYMFIKISNDNFFTDTTKGNIGAELNRDGITKVLEILEAEKSSLYMPTDYSTTTTSTLF